MGIQWGKNTGLGFGYYMYLSLSQNSKFVKNVKSSGTQKTSNLNKIR